MFDVLTSTTSSPPAASSLQQSPRQTLFYRFLLQSPRPAPYQLCPGSQMLPGYYLWVGYQLRLGHLLCHGNYLCISSQRFPCYQPNP